MIGSLEILPADTVSRLGIAGAAAVRAGYVHVGQELYVEADDTSTVTGRTAQTACIVGEIPVLPAGGLGIGSPGVYLAQLVVYVGVCSYGRADIDAYGCRIYQLGVPDTVGLYGQHVVRQLAARDHRLQARHQTLQYQSRLARARHSGHHGQPPLGDIHLQRLHRMYRSRRDMDTSVSKHLGFSSTFPGTHPCPTG